MEGNLIRVFGRWMKPVENRGNGNCFIESVLTARNELINNTTVLMRRFKLMCKVYTETFGCDESEIGKSIAREDIYYAGLLANNFQGVKHARFLQSLEHEYVLRTALPELSDLTCISSVDYVRSTINNIVTMNEEVHYFLFDLVGGRYTVVSRKDDNFEEAQVTLNDNLSMFGLHEDDSAQTHYILYDPPVGDGTHTDAKGHLRLLVSWEGTEPDLEGIKHIREYVHKQKQQRMATKVTNISQHTHGNKSATVITTGKLLQNHNTRTELLSLKQPSSSHDFVSDLLRMEFSSSTDRFGEVLCVCDLHTGVHYVDCPVEQHFTLRDRDALDTTGILFRLCGVQGGKTYHALADACVEHTMNKVIPVVFLRVATCDVHRWIESCNKFNHAISKFTSYNKGHELHPYTKDGLEYFERHIRNKQTGIPILILLYNHSQIKMCFDMMERLVPALPRCNDALPFHIICDESDLVTRNYKADSEAEKQMMHRSFDDEVGSIFKASHSVTFVTATPLANLIVNLRMFREGPFLGCEIATVRNYYGFKKPVGVDAPWYKDPVDARCIQYGRANNVTDVLGDMLSNKRVRRSLFVSADLKRIERQQKLVVDAVLMYDDNKNNPHNKVVFSFDFNGKNTVFRIGGPLNKKTPYINALSSMRAVTFVPESKVYVLLNKDSDVVDFLDTVLATQVSLHQVDQDIECVGPDIVIATGTMGGRGVTFKTKDHHWELTDQYIDGESWHMENTIQALRICGVSKKDVRKTLWVSEESQKKIETCLLINSSICNDLGEGRRPDEILERAKRAVENALATNTRIQGVDSKFIETFLFGSLSVSRPEVSKKWGDKVDHFRKKVNKVLQQKRKKPEDILEEEQPLHAILPEGSGFANVSNDNEQPPKKQKTEETWKQLWRHDSTKTAMIEVLNSFAKERKYKVTNAEMANRIGEDANELFAALESNRNKALKFLAFGKKIHPVNWLGSTPREGVEVVHTQKTFSLVTVSKNLKPTQARILQCLKELGKHVGDTFELDELRQWEHVHGDVATKSHNRPISQLVESGYIEYVKKGTGKYKVVRAP